MDGSAKAALTQLIRVSSIDSTLASLSAEFKLADQKIKEITLTLNKIDAELAARSKNYSDRQLRYQRDEKQLSEERARLVERRKALSTFGGQKVQIAAAREIDATAEKLNAQEEGLLNLLGELESEKAAVEKFKVDCAARKETLVATLEDLKGTLGTLTERKTRHETTRSDLTGQIEKTILTTYQRVRDRYPHNAVVPITDIKTCGGCHMTLVAQTVVQVAKHETLIKCPGCGRIWALAQDIGESKEE